MLSRNTKIKNKEIILSNFLLFFSIFFFHYLYFVLLSFLSFSPSFWKADNLFTIKIEIQKWSEKYDNFTFVIYNFIWFLAKMMMRNIVKIREKKIDFEGELDISVWRVRVCCFLFFIIVVNVTLFSLIFLMCSNVYLAIDVLRPFKEKTLFVFLWVWTFLKKKIQSGLALKLSLEFIEFLRVAVFYSTKKMLFSIK